MSPQSAPERLIGGFMLLGGVITFTYCMGIFIDILNEYKTFFADIEDSESDKLALFFNCIKHLNGGNGYNEDFKTKIEEYFSYYWSKDRNMAVSEDDDVAMLEQLPIFVQDDIYNKFLFNEISRKHTSFFFVNPRQFKIFSSVNNVEGMKDMKFTQE